MTDKKYTELGEFYELQQYKRYAVTYMNKFLATPEEIVNTEFSMITLVGNIERIMEQWERYQDMLVPMLQWQVGATPLAIHSYNVGSISYLLGHDLGLDKQDMFTLTTSALAHDIGKNYISPMILDKNGKLGITERAAMQQHPRLGAIYVKNHYPEMDSIIIDSIFAHHEVEDGTGYYSMEGDEIPIFAKIIRVADIFCALTEDRSYHMSQSCRQSLTKLKKFPYIENDWVEILTERTSNLQEVNEVYIADMKV